MNVDDYKRAVTHSALPDQFKAALRARGPAGQNTRQAIAYARSMAELARTVGGDTEHATTKAAMAVMNNVDIETFRQSLIDTTAVTRAELAAVETLH